MSLFGGIEAGGTKFACVVASGPDDIRAEDRFPTTTPQETLGKVIDFFKTQKKLSGEAITAVGIACFGPLELNPNSPWFGYITSTPKPGWQNADVMWTIQRSLGVPVAFDTDVNVAAIGEGEWGAAEGQDDFIYLTIGTGIGGGGVFNGRPLHGMIHPEMGHIALPHDTARDPYPGYCLFHGDCFEGLASGPAMRARWGQPAETLPPDHPAWDLEATYLARALQNFIFTLSPRRIILGGGVMEQRHLFPLVRAKVVEFLKGYVQSQEILDTIDAYIVPPGLGNRAGVLGAVALARRL